MAIVNNSFAEAYKPYARLYKSDGSDTFETQVSRVYNGLDSIALLTSVTSEYPAPKVSMLFNPNVDKSIAYTLHITAPDENMQLQSNILLNCTGNDFARVAYEGIIAALTWYDSLCSLGKIASDFGEYVNSILRDEEIPLTVEFTCGSGIYNLENKHIGIRLEPGVINKLDYIMGNIGPSRDRFISSVLDTFGSLPCIIECLRRRTYFTKQLGIYTRKTPRVIIRGSYHKQLQSLKSGIGRYEYDGYFSLVEINTYTEQECSRLKITANDIVTDNVNPRSTDYMIAKNDVELEDIKSKLDKKGITYKVVARDNGWYNVVYKLKLVYTIKFGFINLDTYETRNSAIKTDIFDY